MVNMVPSKAAIAKKKGRDRSRPFVFLSVMPGLVPCIHFLLFSKKVVDGRVKPGHPDIGRTQFEARFGGEAGHDLISVS
ncbi:hypothetical protein SAMN05443247_09829 [Bradyrhizobium erythrophlei]|nr:hypothetical protein SAMN05443247_09829 [Bradyrhizobium erythrophlei]